MSTHDLAGRMPKEEVERKLRGKARGLLGEIEADRLWAAVSDFDARSAQDLARLLSQ
jgi:hypothetical protein